MSTTTSSNSPTLYSNKPQELPWEQPFHRLYEIFTCLLFFQKFMRTTQEKSLLQRYIDDIFMLWPRQQSLQSFIQSLNSFHPNIKFTTQSSDNSIDFLDFTIYKGISFNEASILDIKTYQKPLNLYQYLHFTSNHPQSTYKGIIRGECIRYAPTNTSENN